MSWNIAPIESKYYGTKIQDSKTQDEIKIWIPDHFANPFASQREIDAGWSASEEGHDHVESQRDYEYAEVIAEALNYHEVQKAIVEVKAFVAQYESDFRIKNFWASVYTHYYHFEENYVKNRNNRLAAKDADNIRQGCYKHIQIMKDLIK